MSRDAKKFAMTSISSSWRKEVSHNINKFVMSKTRDDVNKIAMTSKKRHDAKKFLFTYKTRHHVKKYVMTSKVN